MCVIGLAAAGPAPGAEAGGGGDAKPSPEALAHFTPEEIARGAERARIARTLWLASLVWGVAVLVALAHPKVGGGIASAAARLCGAREGAEPWRVALATGLAIAMLIAVYVALKLPFAWARGHWLEHRFGLSTRGSGLFMLDWLKGLAVTVALYTVALGAVVALRARMPTWWPLAAWGAVSLLIVAMVFLQPVIFAPIFNRCTPVEHTELRERVTAVASRAGIDVGDVLWVDASRRTRRTNAYFAGLGATRRIVLYDTLRDEDGSVSGDALDEVETILAHEAGHWRAGHIWKGTVLAILGTGAFFLALWFLSKLHSSWVPPSALPAGARAAAVVILAVTVVNFFGMPVSNAISRAWERTADRAALELSAKPGAFVRAEVELSRRNLSEIEPGALTVFWLYTHPPVLERIRMGEESARAKAEGGPE
jgi:STE24 endopeptidase